MTPAGLLGVGVYFNLFGRGRIGWPRTRFVSIGEAASFP